MNELIVSFIVDLNKNNLKLVKNELVKVVQYLEEDSKAYIYHLNNISLPDNKGNAVGKIANYSHPVDFNLISAVQNTSTLLKLEDDSVRKPIFVILDKFNPKTIQLLSPKLQNEEHYIISDKALPLRHDLIQFNNIYKSIISKLNNEELLPIL